MCLLRHHDRGVGKWRPRDDLHPCSLDLCAHSRLFLFSAVYRVSYLAFPFSISCFTLVCFLNRVKA
jgi:hypothetical protein